MQHLGTSGAPTFLKSSRGQGEEDSEVYERIRRGVVGGPVEVQSVSSRGSLIQPTSRGSIGCRHQGGLAPPRLYIPLLSCPQLGSPRAKEVGVSYNQISGVSDSQTSGALQQPKRWEVYGSHRSDGLVQPQKWWSPKASEVGVSYSQSGGGVKLRKKSGSLTARQFGVSSSQRSGGRFRAQ